MLFARLNVLGFPDRFPGFPSQPKSPPIRREPSKGGENELNRSSAAYQLNDQDDQRNDQQNVDIPCNHVKSNKTYQPKYQQDDEYRPKHRSCLPSILLRYSVIFDYRCDMVRLYPRRVGRIRENNRWRFHLRIAIQGEHGSFSHEAALKFSPQATIVPCSFSNDVFDLVEQEDIAAIIPIENSLAGSVAEHFDLLFQRNVHIDGESLLRIRHNLIGIPGSETARVQRVFSHPVALAQCRLFLGRHPQMKPTPAYDTAGSVKHLLQTGQPTDAAIASLQAAAYYGGEVLAADIEDNPANFTRFFLIRRGRGVSPPGNADKVSIAFTIENRPGTLVSALQVFAGYRTNLNKIESRPVRGQPWEYVFYADFQISAPETASAVLDQLRTKCILVKELGCYPAARQAL